MEAPSDLNAWQRDLKEKTRIRFAFLLLFVFLAAGSAGVYYAATLTKPQDSIAAGESQSALQGIADASQLDAALKQHPQNKFLQMIAMATRAANETDTAFDRLSGEIEPPAIARNINLGSASRGDLEALRRDLKVAETSVATLLPRYAALLKTERDNVEKSALSLHLEKEAINRLLDSVDKRHAQLAALTAKLLPARADYYRAYENYVAVLAREYGTYQVVNGQFIFPFQGTVDRYNSAAHAMVVATRRVADLQEERKGLARSQQDGWEKIVNGK
jgi:hypothetical protein